MKVWLVIALCFQILSPVLAGDKTSRLERRALRKTEIIPAFFDEWQHIGTVRADSVHVEPDKPSLNVYLNDIVTQIPVRNDWINKLTGEFKNTLGRRFNKFQINFIAKGRLLDEYVPNYFRETSKSIDLLRVRPAYAGIPLRKNLSQPDYPAGLTGKHLALWPSHGLFYDQNTDRWQWQRARLWQTVEDIFPWSFTIQYLVPMLENAGAVVLLPRERDPGANEIVIDHDRGKGSGQIISDVSWDTNVFEGFKWKDTLRDAENPFKEGFSMSVPVTTNDTVSLSYIPEIPESGDYSVYISYARSNECIGHVIYIVNHSGGRDTFLVNQCMGAGTWLYLGKFNFIKGSDTDKGSVVLKTLGVKGIVSSDAVRFGGGMGSIARKPSEIKDSIRHSWKISGKPRWMEGSRYYLQYAGMPDSIVYNLHGGKNDYNDDYMSRPEWVNYLIGTSEKQYSEKYDAGLGIPVDLSLAFHTDAGISWGDTIIGTLGIYSTQRHNGIFPDGRSKMANRDFTDIVQSQVVSDLRMLVDSQWTRRGLWDREYSEAWRPVVPSMLLELLSHQNLADMKYGLDPRFKFIAARAVYKGILRFLNSDEEKPAVIQPLPPDNLAIEIIGPKKIRISWKAVDDPLEPGAGAKGFRLYRKTGVLGFDNGALTSANTLEIELPEYNTIYSFRVTAINDGGESFPSETLSAGLVDNSFKPVLVVNAFDRICGPAFFDKGDMAGIAWWEDEGVAYIKDYSFTGFQYNFDRNSEWLHDDSPGWGASSASMESMTITGNSFSYPAIHGRAIMNAGFSFVSVSDEAFKQAAFDIKPYDVVDIVFGEERSTQALSVKNEDEFRVFDSAITDKIRLFTNSGGNVIVSGAYVGSDMAEKNDSAAILFAAEVLHYTWRSNHATTMGGVYATDEGSGIFPEKVEFNTQQNSDFYRVESPDAIEPVGTEAKRICRYVSGNANAGVAYSGDYKAITLGFPFETVINEEERNTLMKMILNFFLPDHGK